MIRIILFILLIPVTSLAGWDTLQPQRTSNIGGYLGDVDSQLEAGHIYSDSDKVTFGHETTHGTNARIRNEKRVQNGYYLFNNRVFTISSPDITLAQIARAIPHNIRGGIYQLYLVQQQRDWNDTPLYILDELTAYINGCVVGIDLNLEARTKDSFNNALEMYGYALIARKLSAESNFSELEDLDELMNYLARNRIMWISAKLNSKGWLTDKHKELIDKNGNLWNAVYK